MAQETKPGKVIRLSPKLRDYVEEHRAPKETHDACLRRLLGLPSKKEKTPFERRKFYVLPSDLHTSTAEAKGAAILKIVRMGKKASTTPAERPLEVIAL